MIEKGLLASDIASEVLTILNDPSQRRNTAARVVGFMNNAITELAKDFFFECEDHHRVVNGAALHQTFKEMRRLKTAYFDNAEIPVYLEKDLDGKEPAWRERTGTPEMAIITRHGVRLFPIPSFAGDEFVINGAAITESQGASPQGDGYSAVLDGDTVNHFLEGDGNVPNAFTRNGNLRLLYNYYPRAVGTDDYIPVKLKNALVAYCLWAVVSAADTPETKITAQTYLAKWEMEKAALMAGSQTADLIDQTNKPMRAD